MKNYSKPLWLEKLKSLQYPDYSRYENVDTAYSDFIENTTTAINEIASFKQLCVLKLVLVNGWMMQYYTPRGYK